MAKVNSLFTYIFQNIFCVQKKWIHSEQHEGE